MSFSYCLPNLVELKNLTAVTPTPPYDHVNSGALYLPRPSKFTKPSFFNEAMFPRELGCEALIFQMPCTLAHPLLNPGSTRLISSPPPAPFSVSHNFPVTGSKSSPKLLRMPYA